jgi:cysteinyl-tRNA synthetase
MAVRLYNTLTRRVEDLVPVEPGKVKMYCCGPTTYDVPHAGHARAALAPDLLIRRLRELDFEVLYVRNLTDVDDRILARAKQNGEPPLELSSRMAEIYREQMLVFGCLEPTHEPRVSDNIEPICELVTRLIDKGHAYVVDMGDGKRDVYFSVRGFADYGKLSRRRLDDLQVGARIAEDERKHDPLDFALWKGAGAEDWGWDSPWGRGRPGWHIECSAMSLRYLGHGFDVHAGGMDLIFPHHENEVAQSEAACGGGPFARLWMHNGFVNVDKEKMSKSLGNFVTVRDVFERNDAEALRWFLLGAHYRGPIQFDSEKLPGGRVIFPGVDEAERRVDHLYAAIVRLRELEAASDSLAAPAATPAKEPPELAQYTKGRELAEQQLIAALDDDLNTPVALAALGELARLANELADLGQKRKKDATFVRGGAALARQLRAAISRGGSLLGVLQATPEAYRARTQARRLMLRGLSAEFVGSKVEERARARANKDFAAGDRIRDALLEHGIALRDAPGGTEWTISQ